jgi:hypothetical protein
VRDEEGERVSDYSTFLESKRLRRSFTGIDVADGDIHPMLFDFQRQLTRWALRKGTAALFADTGLGKTLMQLEWARLLGRPTLIVAPLSVARQTVREGRKLNLSVHYTRNGDDLSAGINITNYELLDHFDASVFGAVVLDESSILKSLDGKTRQKLTAMFAQTPYRLCCTATPAPNDIAEISNHAEFLGVMSRNDMLATFFVHDDEGWRLKKHAREPFFRWLASWGMSIRRPSDLGYADDGYILPPLYVKPAFLPSEIQPDDRLFYTGLSGIGERAKVRKQTTASRVQAAADLINQTSGQWIAWCGLNSESTQLARLIPGSVEVTGSDALEEKVSAIEAFQDRQTRVLVTKSKIAGFGMNLQNCHQMAFVGLNDSWETFYQSIRRCYRFGQTEPVDVHIILSDHEEPIYQNVMRKEAEAARMSQHLIDNVQQFERAEITDAINDDNYQTATASHDGWKLMLGDSAERMAEIADDTVGLSVFSPPFMSLYTYTPTERDLGNSRNPDEFFGHFGYIIDHLLRATKPGRNCCVHVAQIPALLAKDGYIGMKDFRGLTIGAFESHGWIYHGEVCIDKDPQAQAIRTHSKGLLFTQLRKDASWIRPAMADYILVFRKPGDNAESIHPDISNDEWIEWARPIWFGIRESDTLNVAEARSEDDERHICPLQLGTIERTIRLWSNPGDLVCSPFAGIGSEGYQSLKFGRRFVGIELKPEYYRIAQRNLRKAESESAALTLFDLEPAI